MFWWGYFFGFMTPFVVGLAALNLLISRANYIEKQKDNEDLIKWAKELNEY